MDLALFHTGRYDARSDNWDGELGAFVPLPHLNAQGTCTSERVVYAKTKDQLFAKVQERLDRFKRTGL